MVVTPTTSTAALMAGALQVNYAERLDKVAKLFSKGSSKLISRLTISEKKKRKIDIALNGLITQITHHNRATFLTLIKRMDGVSSRGTSRRDITSGTSSNTSIGPVLMTIGITIMEVTDLALGETHKEACAIIFRVLLSLFGGIHILMPNFYPDTISSLKEYARASTLENIPTDASDNPATETPPVITIGCADEL